MWHSTKSLVNADLYPLLIYLYIILDFYLVFLILVLVIFLNVNVTVGSSLLFLWLSFFSFLKFLTMG